MISRTTKELISWISKDTRIILENINPITSKHNGRNNRQSSLQSKVVIKKITQTFLKNNIKLIKTIPITLYFYAVTPQRTIKKIVSDLFMCNKVTL